MPRSETVERAAPAPPRDAAVLLLLYPDRHGEPHVPFIRRSPALRHHQGQIALPGGARDPADPGLVDTAQREAWEELRIEPARYRIVGSLAPVYTQVSNFTVHPFVGVAPARPAFQPDPVEVAELLEVPLGWLVDRNCWREELWELPTGPRQVSFCEFGGHRIWGLTARILDDFMRSVVLDHARAEFERRIRHGRSRA